MLLTEDQRLTIKTNSPESKVYLSIYKPTTLLACRVNMASPDRGEVGIVFDSVTAGAYTNVFKWATVLVGTATGKDDVGRIWARECSSDTLIVGLNSLEWADDLYITVLNFVDIWNRPFSIYLSGDTIVYEIDGDTEFASEDVELGTFVCMGGNYAGFAGDQVYWSAEDSENVFDNSVDYVWEFEGGDVSIHSGSIAGNVTYNTPGYYKTKLTATSSNGAVNIGYRYVSIHDPIGNNAPYELIDITNFSGTREEGGWIIDSAVIQDSFSNVYTGFPAVLFARHNFGGTNSDLFKILFSGYVIEKSANYNHISKTVECSLGSASEYMLQRPMTSVSVDSVATASAWSEVSEMTIKKFLYFYLNYFTTALSCFDIKVRSGFDTYVKYFETENISLYENVYNIVNKTREGNAVFDRLGTMWVEQEPRILQDFSSNVSGTFGLEDSDYLDSVYIEESGEEYGSLQLGGFVYTGTTVNTNTPVLSKAPDDKYVFYSGRVFDKQGYAIESQDELNKMSGSFYTHHRAKYKHVEVPLLPLYLNFDIAPLESVPVSITEDKNNIGISWDDKLFYIFEMSMEIYSESLSSIMRIFLHEVTTGIIGTTVIIPQPVEENIDDGVNPGDFPIFPEPNIEFPPYLPTEPEPIDDCHDFYSGPYILYADKSLIIGSEVASERIAKIYYPCNIRSATVNADNPTELYIKADWQKYTTTWINAEEDDYYTVDAIDESGAVVATATDMYEVDTQIKIFRFGTADMENVWGFRIQINEDADEAFHVGTELASGSVDGINKSGETIYASATPGNLYSVRSAGGPVYVRWSDPWYAMHYDVDYGNGWVYGGGTTYWLGNLSWVSPSVAFPYWYRIGDYSRVFFYATNSNIKFRFHDETWNDNSGTLSYVLSEATAGAAYRIKLYGATLYNVCPVGEYA